MKLDQRFRSLVEIQTRTGRHEGALYEGDRAETVEEIFSLAQEELNATRSLRDSSFSRSTPGRGDGRGFRYGAAFVAGGRGRGRGGKSEDKDKGAQKKCSKCNGKGHVEADCTSNDWSEVECFGCGGVGHYKNRCPSDGDTAKK